ncbi:HAD family hydrolase [Nocardioides aurantiacus]|uniref:HAD family hydrolase n=1 Tax=Nocardioides aurantiacus TaxID=86796 RepID=UPI00403F84EE
MITADAVVLDVDDTLYLERDYVRSGFAHLEVWCRGTLGVDGVGDRAWDLFERGVRGSTLTDALAAAGVEVDVALRTRVVDQYRGHRPAIHLLPDAARCLDRLAPVLFLGAVTDGPAVSQRAKVEALGLGHWVREVVYSDELGLSKPDPRVFTRAAELVGPSAQRFVYVADNPAKDFAALDGLGWQGVRVRRAGSLHEHVATPAGVREIADLDELQVTP